MSDNNKPNENLKFPVFFRVIVDGNDTDRGKALRVKMENLGYDEENIENHIQVDHVLNFMDGKTIVFRSLFDFKISRIRMFVDELFKKDVSFNEIIEYLEYLKLENLIRREKYVTKEEIIRDNIKQDKIVSGKDIKLFNKNIKVLIKYLKKNKSKQISQNDNFKLHWLGSREQLELLYNLWKSNDLIKFETKISDFLTNFQDKSLNVFIEAEQIAIDWIGKQNELAYSISELTSPKVSLIASKDIWKITSNIFRSNSGEKFKNLSVLSQKFPKNLNILENIIKKVAKS